MRAKRFWVLPGAYERLLQQILGALPVAVREPEQQGEEGAAVLALQLGQLVLGGRPGRGGGYGRHGRMATRAAPSAQVRDRAVRWAVAVRR